ncbi:MAG: serine hydrolase [Bacteroidota bacterium]
MRPNVLILSLLLLSCSDQKSKTSEHHIESGFQVAELEDSGIQRDSIYKLLTLIKKTPPRDFRGLVVIKNDRLVMEEYFNTYLSNTIHDIRSAGKSITALLLGIAMKDGLIDDLDQDVHSFFSKKKYTSINEDYKKIRIRHLLNMSSGLDADSNDPQTAGHSSNWISLDNWRKYHLSIPMTSEPGTKWIYADINPMLIGAIIEETSGMSLKDYAAMKLFKPLGINQFYWYTNAANQTGAAGNLYLSTIDFAKLGVLVLNKGKWENSQIISEEYMNELSRKTFDISDTNPFADAYGMLWYKSSRTFGTNSIKYLFASGMGGNHLIVIPEKEMVIALTSSAYGQGYGHQRSYNIMARIFESLH